MPPKKKPAALSAKQEEEELSEMVNMTITIIDHHRSSRPTSYQIQNHNFATNIFQFTSPLG